MVKSRVPRIESGGNGEFILRFNLKDVKPSGYIGALAIRGDNGIAYHVRFQLTVLGHQGYLPFMAKY